MKINCKKCGEPTDIKHLAGTGWCRKCRHGDKDEVPGPVYNPPPMPGDIMGTGIPGGIDGDISTPW